MIYYNLNLFLTNIKEIYKNNIKMNKIYKIIPKIFIKSKVPYTIGYKRYNSYNYGKEPDCEFCSDLLFFAVGMWCGYMIGKDKGRRF